MWIAVLVMAAAVSLEPFRIGMTVLMLNRPRPLLQLLAFLLGGFAMGMSVGLIVLFTLRPRLLGADQFTSQFTLPKVQITIGALALLAAAVLASQPVARWFDRRQERRDAADDPDELPDSEGGSGGGGRTGLSTRARKLLAGRSLWVAGVAGIGIALPSVDYLAALAIILASGAPAMTQVAALLTFNVVAFALVEIPLIAAVLAPARTRVVMTALNDWIRSRRRRDVATLLAAVGFVLVVVGISSL